MQQRLTRVNRHDGRDVVLVSMEVGYAGSHYDDHAYFVRAFCALHCVHGMLVVIPEMSACYVRPLRPSMTDCKELGCVVTSLEGFTVADVHDDERPYSCATDCSKAERDE